MPFLYNCIVTFSATWFGVRGRIMSTGFLIFLINLGLAGAQWAVYVKTRTTYFEDAFLGIGIANLFMVFIVAIFFDSKPKLVPTKSQTIY